MDMTELAHAAGHTTEQPESDGPVAPPTLEASGLRQSFVIELLLKHLYLGGELGLGRLAERVCLPAALLTPILKTLRSARLVEPAGVNPGGVASGWRLSATGRARAAEALERCRYAGAAPVTLNDYRDRVRRQAANEEAMPDGALDSVLQGLALDDGICQRLGAALSSTRGLYVFGPPGSGKSALVGRLAMVSRGTVWIPHAVLAGEALIQVFDPSVHRPVGPQTSQVFPSPASWSEPLPALDSRWIACERPTVLAGSRLSSDQFDLQSGTISGASVAPIHLKANNGVLVVDDLGRQREPVGQLLRRIVMPLERGSDLLRARQGDPVEVPVMYRLVLASTLEPSGLDDAGLIRRLGYPIPLGPLDASVYRRLLVETSAACGVQCDPGAADYLIDHLHRQTGVPMLAAYPRELVARICERALWLRKSPALDSEALEWAWDAVLGHQMKGGAS